MANNFIDARKVTCPKPIRNVYGHLYSVESIGGKGHVVRLLEYVPGELLKDVPKSDFLFYQVGEFAASLDNTLQVRSFIFSLIAFHVISESMILSTVNSSIYANTEISYK